MKWNLFLILGFLLSLPLIAQTNDGNKIVAEVEGVKITKESFDQYFKEKLSFVTDKKVTKENALNDLIDRVIGIENARKNNIHKDPDVIKKMNDILYHAQISHDLEGELLKIQVTDKEVKDYYKANPEYRTSQVLFRLRTEPSVEEVTQTLAKANNVYTDIMNKPQDFDQFVAKHGQTANAPIGGDMGYQPKSRLMPEYYEEILNKRVGFITKPFRTQYGFHIVKVTGVKKASEIDMNMYKKIVYDIKRDKILDDYFKKNRKSAKIKIYKENL